MAALDVDLLSMSAHKCYGPKGIGALFVRRRSRCPLVPQMHGGGHERGLRSGTLPTHQIVGFGAACALAGEQMARDREQLASLRARFLIQLEDLPGVHLNGAADGWPGIINLSFEGVDGETLLMALKDLAVSTGSACASATLEPSYVLRAIGRDEALALSSLRFSLGRHTTDAEIDFAARQVGDAVGRLRAANQRASQ